MSNLESIGDPFDDMNIDEKKKFALFWYYSVIKVSSISLSSFNLTWFGLVLCLVFCRIICQTTTLKTTVLNA